MKTCRGETSGFGISRTGKSIFLLKNLFPIPRAVTTRVLQISNRFAQDILVARSGLAKHHESTYYFLAPFSRKKIKSLQAFASHLNITKAKPQDLVSVDVLKILTNR
jgi:hypothetical protein